ncbi:hypothetical protein [Bosea psychrotolerans]|uniref:Uncharacterized protein n=1 Tax=Bosea psychrotolerans TaxID=1871628 RepID=A0A2S4MDV7_9HYPH|nr:hypothetical protein [Bosea psychrotolerans]POR52617.1 hypothetical protein CYD53_105282 [Bosea psychrotolerans]
MAVQIHITSMEIYHAAKQRISDQEEAGEGTPDKADRLALVEAAARWDSEQGEFSNPVV